MRFLTHLTAQVFWLSSYIDYGLKSQPNRGLVTIVIGVLAWKRFPICWIFLVISF